MILVRIDGRVVFAERVHVSKLPEYNAWSAMHDRCRNKRCRNYKNYGRRGIRVVPEWKNFLQFYKDMGPRPTAKHSLHRKDNEEHYGPTNCVWADDAEQRRNKQNTVWVEYEGKRLRLTELVEKTGASYALLRGRLKMGWPVEIALQRNKYGKHYRKGAGRRKALVVESENRA